jgi:hypothetical protein
LISQVCAGANFFPLASAGCRTPSHFHCGHHRRGRAAFLKKVKDMSTESKLIETLISAISNLSDEGRKTLFGTLAASITTTKKPAARGTRTINEVSAASSEHAQLLRTVTAQARRLGFDIDPAKPIDTVAMDKAFKGADPTARLVVKSQLAKLGLIP